MNPEVTRKNPRAMEHLTELELGEVLLGEASQASLDHLAACGDCNTRMDAISQPIASFRDVSLAWAEQRSSIMPMPVVVAPAFAAAEAEQPTAYLAGHLSDDQLDAVLIEGIEGASPAVAAHLAGCNPCAVRLDAVAQPVASFQAVSLAWSERRSATMPLREEGFGRAASRSWGRRYSWVAATAAVVAVALAVPMHRGRQQPLPNAVPDNVALNHRPAVTTGTPKSVETASTTKELVISAPATKDQLRRQRQIDADNQMLAAIDHELDASQATLAAYGVTVSSSPAHSRTRGATTQE